MPKLVKTRGWGGQEIRQFNDSGIQKQINDAVASIPKGKRIAVVGYASLRNKSVSGAVVYRLGRDWSVVGTVRHKVGRGTDAGLGVLWCK